MGGSGMNVDCVMYVPGEGWVQKPTTGLTLPVSVVMKITPEFAKEVLDNHNARNRNVSPSRVKKLARDIVRGAFQVTNQGIGFAHDGHLNDGQHRLAAVVEAGMPITSLVMFGLAMDAQKVVDDNFARSDHDVATLSGFSLSEKAVAIGSFMLETSQGYSSRKLTRQERVEFYRRHQDALNFAASILGLTRLWYNKTPICAVVARAYYSVPKEQHQRLRDFGALMKNGQYIIGEDDAGQRLREWALVHRDENSGNGRRELYWKTESALRYFLEKKVITKLYAASEELFPLPEERF